MARSLPENGDAVRMPLLGFPGPGAGKGMASCHAFSAVHAAIRVSRMAVRHAAWTDNGLAISVLADFRRRSSGRMTTGGTGLPERALAPEGSRRPRQQNPRLGMARHRIPDRTAGAGRPQAACVHD